MALKYYARGTQTEFCAFPPENLNALYGGELQGSLFRRKFLPIMYNQNPGSYEILQ